MTTSAPRFSGKLALVTGGASGIGAATARALAAEGARVAVLDLPVSSGPDVAREIGGVFAACDVAEPEQWAAAVAHVTAELGGLDLVHLNAGVTTRPPEAGLGDDVFDWIDRGAYRRLMRVNVDGVVFGLRAVVPALRRRGGGAVVATASVAGLIGFPPDPYYTMSKHAVVGLVRSFAPHLEPLGIRLNAICPGGVDTPIIPHSFRSRGFALMPPSELAAAVLDLLAAAVTGEAWVKPRSGIAAYRYDAPAIRVA